MSDSTPISIPIYADRVTGENFADATTMVNAYLRRFAQKFPHEGDGGHDVASVLDASGYAHVQRGKVTVGINVLERQGVLMIFAPIMEVPSRGRESFYRRILELSFIRTSDAAFAIDGARSEVVVRSLRRLSALDYEEFEDLVTTVGDVADTWHDTLIREYPP
ncbi:YbjN domain-containing protein [Polyangium aurulentum]|uniref:YbjN domain-containing protein n=1 Tax=Polyangium aurulentum TaxID=2567896 RepID=UPI001F16E193|nr:YbjN domain-containing protein [Polyangium aurulentum]